MAIIKRILKTEEFADIYRRGRRIKGTTGSLYIKKDPAEKGIKLGVTVSKKAVSLATRRNYIKRLVYAYFRANKGAWRSGYETVFRMGQLPSRQKKALSQMIRQDIAALTEKAGLLK